MMRRVSSWVTGRHMPAVSYRLTDYEPTAETARIEARCRDCGLLLTRYRRRDGKVSLRHHPRRKS